jgi:hypothetical protein
MNNIVVELMGSMGYFSCSKILVEVLMHLGVDSASYNM